MCINAILFMCCVGLGLLHIITTVSFENYVHDVARGDGVG